MSLFSSKSNVHAKSLGKVKTNIFLADKDFKIIYANDSAQDTQKAAAELSTLAQNMQGIVSQFNG